MVRRTLGGLPLALVAADAGALAISAGVVHADPLYALIFSAVVLIARFTLRHYRSRMALSVLDDVPRTLASACIGMVAAWAVAAVLVDQSVSGIETFTRGACFLAAAVIFQALAFRFAIRGRRRGRLCRPTLVVGTGRVADTVAAALVEHRDLGLHPIGFAQPEPVVDGESLSLPVLTTDMGELADVIKRFGVDTVILALGPDADAHVDTIIGVHQTGCTILLVPAMFELHHDGPDVERVRGVPLLRLRPDPTLRPSWWVKRIIDITVAAVGLLLVAVPLTLVAVAILIESGRPILFWQERVGLDGRTFRLCKFRSLRPVDETESQVRWNIADDPRVGRVGKFLRRSSIDEIPQLWNILAGHMSLVGPRPERPTFVQQFSAEHERYWARHRVPVGLTGLAQVNGLRGDTSIRERARYDNYYIANWSLWLDAKVVMLTAREVLGGRGR
jgi:exopolysaccharide biosynthesis polyprenyl glycosylphosphotransferase